MTIEQLRFFLTVAQLENISRASEVLYVNQPTLSKSIIKLETELETPLFDRNGKNLSLNAQGERFMECAELILRELETAEADMKRMRNGEGSAIRIGAAGCADLILSCAAAFRKQHPEAEFLFDFSVEEQDNLDINDYDALIYPESSKYERFSGYTLSTETYYLAVPQSHPFASLPAVSVKQLSEPDIVFLRHGRSYSDFPHRVSVALNLPFRSVSFTDTRQSQLQMVASGLACALIPNGDKDFCSDRRIRLVPLVSNRFSRTMKLCFKREKHLSPTALAFRSFALEYLSLAPNADEQL